MPEPEEGVILLNVSDETDHWNRRALAQSHKERVFIRKAVEANFTEAQAVFMWEFLMAKDSATAQNYSALKSGDFDPKLP